MYVLNLAVNHFLGGLIYLLPWYYTPQAPQVELGFEATMYALLAFTLGNAIVTPLIVRLTGWPRIQATGQQADPWLAKIYLGIALVSYFVLIPLFGNLPTLGALLNAGWTFLVVGLALLIWQAYQQRKWRQLFYWFATLPLLPFLTVITQGFLGYGTVAILIVVTFMSTFYRPRWHVVIAAVLGVYLGLSVFVTYMRDRSDIRDAVWGGAAYGSRFERLVTTFSHFELIDLNNQEHLTLIDSRLNQNYLVGAAVDYLSNGRGEYAKGETILNSFLALIPRAIWPDKPFRAGSEGLVTEYTGIVFGENTSVGIGQVMEFYINFGYTGIVIGFFVIGVLIGLIDKGAVARLKENDWQGFAIYFLPGLGLLQVGGSLGEMTTTAGAALVTALLVNRILLWKLRIQKTNTTQPEDQPEGQIRTLPNILAPRGGRGRVNW
ncbi:MAG: hypothetical protein HY011_21835 [Acidobacteria bacterium]|nr:hypothetical protein [Acidobacteriota bacterium]